MKKKISLIICLCLMVLGLAACGGSTETEYFNKKYTDIQSEIQQFAGMLTTPDSLERAFYKATGPDEIKNLIDTWDKAVDGLGAYQELGELTITKTQNTVTAEQLVNYPGRQMVVTFVYTYDYGEKELILTNISADMVYTLGEKMAKAGLNTPMGMGTVFSVLILISLLIFCFRFIPNGQTKKAPEKSAAPAPVPVSAPVQAQKQLTDDLELVAVITAAIAASTGTSSDGFVVRSIRRR